MEKNDQKRGYAKFPELGIAVMTLMDVLVTIYNKGDPETGAETQLMDTMAQAITDYENEILLGSKKK